VSKKKVDQLSLRDLFTDAERLTRDLIDHLEHGFIPKVQALNTLMLDGGEQLEDLTVRNSAATVLEGHAFSQKLLDKLDNYYLPQTMSGMAW
jgi:hypothetical protein